MALKDLRALRGTTLSDAPAEGESIAGDGGIVYRVGARIGEGIHGVVFECQDPWANHLVVKVFKPFADPAEVELVAREELRLLRDLCSPHITYAYGGCRYRNTFCVITERCACEVKRLFRTDRFDGMLWLLPVARSLLQAVHHMHVRGVVHQDIHQGNVFATFARDEMTPGEPGGIQFKLGDFTTAKALGEVDISNDRASVLKPPEALAPAEFGPVDHRIDIYHTALLLLQLAYSRELQFSSDDVLAGKPRALAGELPPPLSSALAKALSPYPSERTSSALEFWRDLMSASAALGQANRVIEPPPDAKVALSALASRVNAAATARA